MYHQVRKLHVLEQYKPYLASNHSNNFSGEILQIPPIFSSSRSRRTRNSLCSANEEFKINYSFKKEGEWKIELYNLLGEKILEKQLISESLNGEYSISTQNLPNGAYLVRLADGYIQNSQMLNISH